MCAAKGGLPDTVRILLEHGADVNAQNSWGELHKSLSNYQYNMIAVMSLQARWGRVFNSTNQCFILVETEKFNRFRVDGELTLPHFLF